MSASRAPVPVPAPPRKYLPPATRLSAELLLNRLAMQLDQVRYLASERCDPAELRNVVVLLKLAHGLAFRNPALWAWLARPRGTDADGRVHGDGSEPHPPDLLDDVDESGLPRASELVDEASGRLARLGETLQRLDTSPAWYD